MPLFEPKKGLCLEGNVQSDQDRYKLLDKFVTWGDKQNYRIIIPFNFIGGEGLLSDVLFHRSKKHLDPSIIYTSIIHIVK